MPTSQFSSLRGHDGSIRVPDMVVLTVGALSACAIAVGSVAGVPEWWPMVIYGLVSGGAGTWLLSVRNAASDPGWRRYLGAALVLWGTGQLLMAAQIALDRYSSPNVADLVSTAAFPVLAAGITRAVRSEAFVRPVLRMVIDAVLMGSASSVLVWRLVFQPGDLTGSTQFFVALVTGIDFVVGAFGLLVYIRRPGRSTGLFALGLVLFAIADAGASYRDDLNAAVPAVACALYCIAMTGFAVGTRMVVPEPADGQDVRRDVREASATIVITAVVVTAAMVHVAVYRRVPTLPPIVFTVFTILAFFVRHLVDHAQRGDLFARLRSQLVTDPLTGVSTRYVLDDLDGRRAPSTLDVIVVGVEGLGRLNSSKGHAEGDALLVRVGGALRDEFPDALAIVRVDSDEFVIVVNRVDVPIEIAVLARDVTHEASIATLDTSVRVRATVGVASGKLADRDVFDVIGRAQRARHLATTTPGISVRMYDDAMLARDERDRFIDARLPKAIERGDITVHFQPIVLLTTGRVVGVESLARWTDPLLGVVNPLEFIGRAEATGHIDALGLSILRQAARAAVSLGLPARQIAMGVNVSASQLRRHHAGRGFADDVAVILAECGLPPGLLAIAVTESMLVEEHGPAVDELHRLHSMGVQIVIDDFGSGHWALGYFRWLTADVVKIDSSLVATLAHDERSRAVVASIVDLSRRIGMETIAEGVEDDDVAATAAHLGVNALQGWNYARAVPYDDLARTIDQLDARADAIRMAVGIAPVPARAGARAGS